MGTEARVETATVLFTDLVASTAMRVELGEEEADRRRRRHDELVHGAIAGHNGRVVKHTGDGVMATFEGASDAVAAAVAIQQALDAENRRTAGPPLRVRAGISVGDVSVEDGDCFGLPVVEAQRLEAAAEPGQILASSVVRALVRGRGGHRFRPVGELDLKGLDEAVAADEVEWDPLEAPTRELPPALVQRGAFAFAGRRRQQDQVHEHWRAVRDGATRVVLVAGEPGAGKTRLAAEAATRAQAEGGLVLAGRCDELVGSPYQPFAEALRFQLRSGDSHTLGPLAGELVRLVPELDSIVPGLPAPLRADPDAERTKLFDAVAGWLRATAGHQPVLLVLDDLHWADHGSLLLMRHVAVTDPVPGLLVVGTYRDTDVDRRHPLQSMLAELRRRGEVERIALDGLDRDEVIELMAAAAGHDLEGDALVLAAALHDETAGNPFFVGEVLRHLAETGAITQRDGLWAQGEGELTLPEGVRDVVGRRVSALPDGAQELLEVAAVVGARFALDVVALVAGRDGDDVADLLEPAVAAHLVEETAAGQFRFSHALVRATLHQELSSTRRARLHRKTAEAIEKLDGADDLGRATELAHHWSEASAAGEAVRALDAARHAAELAMAAAAPLEAARWYARALDLVDEANVRERVELMILAAGARTVGGVAGADREAVAAARLAEQLDDVDLMAEALGITVRTSFAEGEPVDEERIELLERAVAMADAKPAAPAVRAGLYAALALELLYTGVVERRAALCREAEALAAEVGDPGERHRLHVLIGRADVWSTHRVEHYREWLAHPDHLHGLASGDAVTRRDALVEEFVCALRVGDGPRSRSAVAAMQELAARTRHPVAEDTAPFQAMQRHCIDGELYDAEGTMQDMAACWSRHGRPSIGLYVSSIQFQVARERGMAGALADILGPEDNDVPTARSGLRVIALVESGRIDDAAAMVDARGRRGFADVPDEAGLPVAWGLWSEACARVGDAGACRAWHEILAQEPGLHFATGAWYLGSPARNLGLLAGALGARDEAREWLARAAAAHEAVESPPWLARGLLDWAELERADGNVAGALELAERAVAAIGDLPLDASRARAAAILASRAGA